MRSRTWDSFAKGLFVLGMICIIYGIWQLKASTVFDPYDFSLERAQTLYIRSIQSPVFLCEQWSCEGTLALPGMCESSGGILRPGVLSIAALPNQEENSMITLWVYEANNDSVSSK